MSDTTEFETMLRDWILNESENPGSFREMEQSVRKLLQRIGRLLLSLWLMWMSRQYRDPGVKCPTCGDQANYVRQREACLHTMYGQVSYKRALYHCASCGGWHSALDQALRLRPNAMSAEVERLVAQLGVHMPFAQASTLFEALTLVRVSDQSIAKATQAYTKHEIENRV